MKVALLGPYPVAHPRAGLAGGVDAVMQALAEGLAGRHEIELHVVTSVPGLRTPETRCSMGWSLHLAPHPRGDRLLWHQPAVWPVQRALTRIAPDVIHAHMAGHFADAALRSGRPAVITLHGVVFREAALALAGSALPVKMRWQLDALFERWIVRRARDLIAISPYVADEYRALTAARFHAIENPVPERFFAVPEAPVAARHAPRLLCVARVIPRKDILTLIEIFAAVRARFPAAQLEIAGSTEADPAYTVMCREAIHRLGLADAVRFLGGMNSDALAAAYARADLALLTSRQETAPVVIAEAMAAARPVVATQVGGVPHMVRHGQTGLLAPAGDAAGLADAALALLADPERRAAFGCAARAAAQRRFRLAGIVDRTVSLYQQLIAERSGQGAQ